MIREPWVWYLIVYATIGFAVWTAIVLSLVTKIEQHCNVSFFKALVLYFVESLPLFKGIANMLFEIAIWPISVVAFILCLEDMAKNWSKKKYGDIRELY